MKRAGHDTITIRVVGVEPQADGSRALVLHDHDKTALPVSILHLSTLLLLRDVPQKPSPFKQPSILTYLHVNHHD